MLQRTFHWLFHLTVPLAAPHVSLLIHILILYLSPKQIPGSTHPVSSHVLPYFGIHYLYLASLPLITCLNSSAISTVIFLLFDFFYPHLPHLAFTLSGLYRRCDWQLLIKKGENTSSVTTGSTCSPGEVYVSTPHPNGAPRILSWGRLKENVTLTNQLGLVCICMYVILGCMYV